MSTVSTNNITINTTTSSIKNVLSLRCILATDMARHNEIVTSFNAISKCFEKENPEHRLLVGFRVLLCYISLSEVIYFKYLINNYIFLTIALIYFYMHIYYILIDFSGLVAPTLVWPSCVFGYSKNYINWYLLLSFAQLTLGSQ